MTPALAQTDDRKIQIDGQCFNVLGRLAEKPAMLIEAPDGTRREMSQTAFCEHVAAGHVSQHDCSLTASKGRIPSTLERREQELRVFCLQLDAELRQDGLPSELRRAEIHTRIDAQPRFRMCRTRHPSTRTLQLWRKAFSDHGRDRLLPRTHLSGNRTPRVSIRFEEIVLDLLEAWYTRSDRPTFAGLCASARKQYREKCGELGERPGPCGDGAVRTILQDLPHDDLLRQRLGRDHARKRTLKAGRLQKVEAPYDRVEIDSTLADIHVVDPHGHPVARPTICVAIDCATGMVLALRVSLDAPREALVTQAIRDIMEPIPEDFFERYGIENRLNIAGRPKTIIVDQGSENSGPHLQAVIRNAELEFGKMIPGHPEKKPFVERHFREVNRFLHTLPGASATADIAARERTDRAMEEACLTLEELEISLQRWRFDGYAQLPRRRVQSPLRSGLSPMASWRDCAARMFLPEPPTPEERLRIFMVSAEHRTLHRYGIELHGIQYCSPSLIDLLRRVGPGCPLEIRYDPLDIREIAVWNPDSRQHIAVPAKADELPAISFAELANLRKATRADPNTVDGVRALLVRIATEAEADFGHSASKRSKAKRPRLQDRRRSEQARLKQQNIANRSERSPTVVGTPEAPRPVGRLRVDAPADLPEIETSGGRD